MVILMCLSPSSSFGGKWPSTLGNALVETVDVRKYSARNVINVSHE